MALLDGKKLAKTIRKEIKVQVATFVEQYGRVPALDVVLVGEDPASRIYVRSKGRACKKVGVASHEHLLPAETSQAKLLDLVCHLNADPKVDGILVQLPLPEQINQDQIINAIDPAKDVDGFHPVSLGNLLSGKPTLVPCTPLACMRLLEETEIDLTGKNAVVVGRSTIVGKPVALLLLQRHATVTICHSRTAKLAHIIAEADIVIAAVGVPELIKGDWIKRGAVVIDVGINRLEDGRLVGDVAFDTAISRALAITPVPGGVGPMTIACLLSNTLSAARARLG
jgi:methylenetetrahydrofolate dehydrogenase (NADP+) / methenyltetrahydrofolate cyclohydrolase